MLLCLRRTSMVIPLPKLISGDYSNKWLSSRKLGEVDRHDCCTENLVTLNHMTGQDVNLSCGSSSDHEERRDTLLGASMGNPTRGKSHEEGGLAKGKGWDQASGVPLDFPEHLPQKPESACFIVLCFPVFWHNRGLSLTTFLWKELT